MARCSFVNEQGQRQQPRRIYKTNDVRSLDCKDLSDAIVT